MSSLSTYIKLIKYRIHIQTIQVLRRGERSQKNQKPVVNTTSEMCPLVMSYMLTMIQGRPWIIVNMYNITRGHERKFSVVAF